MVKYFNTKNIKKSKKNKKKISNDKKTLILMYDSSPLTLNMYSNGAIMLAIKSYNKNLLEKIKSYFANRNTRIRWKNKHWYIDIDEFDVDSFLQSFKDCLFYFGIYFKSNKEFVQLVWYKLEKILEISINTSTFLKYNILEDLVSSKKEQYMTVKGTQIESYFYVTKIIHFECLKILKAFIQEKMELSEDAKLSAYDIILDAIAEKDEEGAIILRTFYRLKSIFDENTLETHRFREENIVRILINAVDVTNPISEVLISYFIGLISIKAYKKRFKLNNNFIYLTHLKFIEEYLG